MIIRGYDLRDQAVRKTLLPWLVLQTLQLLLPSPLLFLQLPSLPQLRPALQHCDRRTPHSSYMHGAEEELLRILHKLPPVVALMRGANDDDEPLSVSFEMTAMA